MAITVTVRKEYTVSITGDDATLLCEAMELARRQLKGFSDPFGFLKPVDSFVRAVLERLNA